MMTVGRLCGLIAATRFRFADEAGLQAGLAELLANAGVPFVRELDLRPCGRIDFHLPAGAVTTAERGDLARIGIETKTQGSPSAVLEQMMGYARHDEVDALVIVTSRIRLGRVPAALNGKPVYSVPLWANGL